jgi:hypothetical protein
MVSVGTHGTSKEIFSIFVYFLFVIFLFCKFKKGFIFISEKVSEILKKSKNFRLFLDFLFLIEMSMAMKQEEPSSTWVKVWQNAASIRTPRHHTAAHSTTTPTPL